MPSTSLGLRYPAGTDSANIAQYFQNLATDVNTQIGPKGQLGLVAAAGWTTSNARYWKMADGDVRLTGVMVNTSAFTPAGDLMATLPTGYRPIQDAVWPVFNSTTYACFVRVTTTGRVEAFRSAQNVSIGASSGWTLDPIRFPTV